jgi:hypothetical protein
MIINITRRYKNNPQVIFAYKYNKKGLVSQALVYNFLNIFIDCVD